MASASGENLLVYSRIPLVDLKTQYQRLKPQMDQVVGSVLESAQFINGPIVRDFEEAFAGYCKVEHAIGVGSGTSALHLALTALDIGPCDEVILPAHTFVATVEPVVLVGARPVFADIDPKTYTIDPGSVERCLSNRTRAVIAVHLYGQMADMDGLQRLIAKTGQEIAIIEDAAQAHGAMQSGRRAGSIGDIGCFSFYPGKNLGAYGDAGAVTTDSAPLAHRIRKLRDHGREDKYRHDLIGFNYRLDALQAAVLREKLHHLESWNRLRRSRAAAYDRQLAGIPEITPPHPVPDNVPVHHLYVVQSEDRDGLKEHLAERGIASGIHYPIPLHLQPALRSVDFAADSLHVTEHVVERILSLPMYPELTDEQIARVTTCIRRFQTRGRAGAEDRRLVPGGVPRN